ncbi:MAG: hypothetical protein RLZ87_1190 [Armatimonadota bacterium]|jgi:general secretion pathway protein G|nr:type II secretion system major pseudopilin GspG [Fimbriimonadaceae bacterium]MCE2768148.1 type II secretion system major pseudopilin GspG [Fimbriimonadaceae bacterium]MCX6341986.1 type II secretion system major pseudopilin GspG [Fimbriimonadales bacterium]
MKIPLKNKKARGFTLIELMVVVLIIAVLASLLVPKVIGKQDEAKAKATLSNIARISSVLNNFRLDCDRYPTNEEGLNALVNAPSDANGWKGPYIEGQVPLDAYGNDFVYQTPGPIGEDSFFLSSNGKDNQPNTDDDISNLDL